MSSQEGCSPGAATARSSRDRPTSMFVRDICHPPQRVWTALTDPRELEQWAPFVPDVSLANPGAATLSMTHGGTVATFASEITRAEAPLVLEYSWGEDLLVWELRWAPMGTRLVLNHTIASRDSLPKAAAWQIRLVLVERLMDSKPAMVCAATRTGRKPARPHLTELLTERQIVVLRALLQGKSNKLIGGELNIAEGTVKNHLWSIYQALGVTTRLQVVARVYELGLMTDLEGLEGGREAIR
jgi:DNA-binding CsgD family transcriptional regulator/uncharacterized protein YndB with AHSA1/START domain